MRKVETKTATVPRGADYIPFMSHQAPRTHSGTRRLRQLAFLLDQAIPIPGTRWRIGLDGIIGLIPGIGDSIGGIISMYIVAVAARSGVPFPALLRMILNVGIEWMVGTVPVLGDLFDFAWKANTRNLALMDASIRDPRRTSRQSWALVIAVVAILAGIAALLALGVVRLLIWLRTMQ